MPRDKTLPLEADPEALWPEAPREAFRHPDADPFVASDADFLVAAPAVTVDPWKHRRGEPRIFALGWTTYLLIAVVGGVVLTPALSGTGMSAISPAARNMIIVIAAGCAILWPMFRLSQAPPVEPTRPITAMLLDLIIVALPVQVIVWPLVMLAGWALDVVAVLSIALVATCVLSGGLLAATLELERVLTRGNGRHLGFLRMLAMLLVIAIPAAGPVWLALRSGEEIAAETSPLDLPVLANTPRLERLARASSPFTLVHLVSGTGIAGPRYRVPRDVVALQLGISGAGFGLWLVALSLAAGGPRRAEGLRFTQPAT